MSDWTFEEWIEQDGACTRCLTPMRWEGDKPTCEEEAICDACTRDAFLDLRARLAAAERLVERERQAHEYLTREMLRIATALGLDGKATVSDVCATATALRGDRDEWRTQHENALASWRTDVATWQAKCAAANAKADQYVADWMAAKHEFGTQMAKAREQIRAAEAERDEWERQTKDADARLAAAERRMVESECRLAAAERERDEARDQWSAHQRTYNARAVNLRQSNVDRDAALAHAEAMARDMEARFGVRTCDSLAAYRKDHPKEEK